MDERNRSSDGTEAELAAERAVFPNEPHPYAYLGLAYMEAMITDAYTHRLDSKRAVKTLANVKPHLSSASTRQ